MFIWELWGGGGETYARFILILSHFQCCLTSLPHPHMQGEIKIRCLQNENPGSSPARPRYYAGNIKSIPRFRHLSPPKKKKMSYSVWSHRLACLPRRPFMAQTRCLSYWDEEIPVSGHSWENPPTSHPTTTTTPPCLPPFSHSQQGEVNLYFSNLFLSP